MARIRRVSGGVLISGIGAGRIFKNIEMAPKVDYEEAIRKVKELTPVYSEKGIERLRELGKISIHQNDYLI